MQIGEVVIHHDVIGVVVKKENDLLTVANKDDKHFQFLTKDCTSVITPSAQACLVYKKLLKRIGK